MPSTIVHLAVQGIGNQSLIRNIDLKWVFLGCVVPDIPWIMQRIAPYFASGIDRYDLRLYVGAQASLALTLVLCAAFSVFSPRPKYIFGILAANSSFHLLLDACEIKWGNGIHLFAPFSWELTNFGFIWPDSLPNYLFSIAGVIYIFWVIGSGRIQPIDFRIDKIRASLFVLFISVYFLMPFAFMDAMERSDNYSIATLRDVASRPGKLVSFDRNRYLAQDHNDALKTFAGETLHVTDYSSPLSAAVSVVARFTSSDTISIIQLHVHRTFLRDLGSYVGLSLVVIVWILAFRKSRDVR